MPVVKTKRATPAFLGAEAARNAPKTARFLARWKQWRGCVGAQNNLLQHKGRVLGYSLRA
jgi:hypothetical protein